MVNNIFTKLQVEEIKKQIEDKEEILLLCNKEQKIKIMRLGKRTYEIIINYGEKNYNDCVVNMYFSK